MRWTGKEGLILYERLCSFRLRKIGMGSREWMGGKLFRMEWIWENVLLGNDLVVGWDTTGEAQREPGFL